MIGIFSRGMRDILNIHVFLQDEIIYNPSADQKNLWKIAGWGVKSTAIEARRFAEKHNIPYISVEDGFLRSFGLGVLKYPPLSLVVDETGIYYDATRPSALENMLNNDDLSDPALHSEAIKAIDLIVKYGLSKYNHAPDIDPALIIENGRSKVLVIDQTYGDMSVIKGMADAGSFKKMLDAALNENPDADIYIKIHPDVVSGKKKGYLTRLISDKRVSVISTEVNPISLLKFMDRVYTVTSQMGFEALLLNKPVTCFGVPFYSGWGVTDDRVAQPRRTRKRSVKEIFIAAYMKYCRYLDPKTDRLGTIFDVIEHLGMQRKMASQNSGRLFFFGFRLWKRHYIRSFFSGYHNEIIYAGSIRQAIRKGIDSESKIVVWGHREPEGISDFASSMGCEIWRIEDGFIRSLGLGSDLVMPMSLVLDKRGIYYDATRESDLQHILNTHIFTDEMLERAEKLRTKIVNGNITKYNTEEIRKPDVMIPPGKKVIFVPGQVEDDASIRYGTKDISTNMNLLKEVRRLNPDDFIIYKPHPDVMARNRKGTVSFKGLKGICDHVETVASVISCIGIADEVHTMTSLTGFDALLRLKKVVTYGMPFYAGWGLTEDRIIMPRRKRRLSLNELVAGALILYPRYYDWRIQNFVDCETIVDIIIAERNKFESEGRISNLKPGYLERRIKKTILLLKGLAGK